MILIILFFSIILFIGIFYFYQNTNGYTKSISSFLPYWYNNPIISKMKILKVVLRELFVLIVI